jgi:hypothetical protein
MSPNRQELAHGEHRAADPQRRQDGEHVVVLGLADLEPFAGIERCVVIVPSRFGRWAWRSNRRNI